MDKTNTHTTTHPHTHTHTYTNKHTHTNPLIADKEKHVFPTTPTTTKPKKYQNDGDK